MIYQQAQFSYLMLYQVKNSLAPLIHYIQTICYEEIYYPAQRRNPFLYYITA